MGTSESREGLDGQPLTFTRQIAPEKLGKYTWGCVIGYRGACYEALTRAENAHGRPPYVLEICQHWNSAIPMIGQIFVLIGLQEIFRNDECLADPENNRFSINPAMQSTAENPTPFDLYSDRIARIFPTYVLDEGLRIRPGPETPRVNLVNLKELLLSTDLARNAELEWASPKNLRFLDGSDL